MILLLIITFYLVISRFKVIRSCKLLRIMMEHHAFIHYNKITRYEFSNHYDVYHFITRYNFMILYIYTYIYIYNAQPQSISLARVPIISQVKSTLRIIFYHRYILRYNVIIYKKLMRILTLIALPHFIIS